MYYHSTQIVYVPHLLPLSSSLFFSCYRTLMHICVHAYSTVPLLQDLVSLQLLHWSLYHHYIISILLSALAPCARLAAISNGRYIDLKLDLVSDLQLWHCDLLPHAGLLVHHTLQPAFMHLNKLYYYTSSLGRLI